MRAMRSLVLDDEPALVNVIAGMLQRDGWVVDTATEGTHALQLFAEHRHQVVVLDYRMPKMDGFEVMARLHDLEPDTQIIMVTGYASLETATQAVNHHAFAFLSKPVPDQTLRKFVADAFNEYNRRLPENLTGSDDRRIEELYEEVARHSAELDRNPTDKHLQAQYRASLVRLRAAQQDEANEARRAFEAHLDLKPGTGNKAIAAARGILDRDKSSD